MNAERPRAGRQPVLVVSPDEQWRRLHQEQLELFGYHCLAWDGSKEPPGGDEAAGKPLALVDVAVEEPDRILARLAENCRVPILVVSEDNGELPEWTGQLADVAVATESQLLQELGRLARQQADGGGDE